MPIPNATLCGAKARQRGGLPCRQPAMANGRCRLHGGKCTGPKTEEGRRRQHMASYKHGMRSKEAIEERRSVRALIKASKELTGHAASSHYHQGNKEESDHLSKALSAALEYARLCSGKG